MAESHFKYRLAALHNFNVVSAMSKELLISFTIDDNAKDPKTGTIKVTQKVIKCMFNYSVQL